MFKLAAVLALAAVVAANDPYPAGYKQAGYKDDYYTDPKYAFDWAVKDDYSYNNYGQYETRDGYNTDGSYHVLLPDGRVQNVKYYVNGDSGYVADVTYSGEAKYDTYKAAPSYKVDTYAPAPYKAAPAYKPAYKPAPAYKAEPYAPAPYAPAPYAPAPYAPAPYAPAPYAPAPYKAPVAYKAPAYKAPAYKAPAYKAPAY